MTVEKIRELIKVHIKAAEAVGKFTSALALLELLDTSDYELTHEATIGDNKNRESDPRPN